MKAENGRRKSYYFIPLLTSCLPHAPVVAQYLVTCGRTDYIRLPCCRWKGRYPNNIITVMCRTELGTQPTSSPFASASYEINEWTMHCHGTELDHHFNIHSSTLELPPRIHYLSSHTHDEDDPKFVAGRQAPTHCT